MPKNTHFFARHLGLADDVIAVLDAALHQDNPMKNYVFANSRLQDMSPIVVAEKYYSLLSEWLVMTRFFRSLFFILVKSHFD